MSRWHRHPGVRSGSDLTLGERAADQMRNGMGSWPFVLAALGFLGVWILVAEFHVAQIDNSQLTILNLVLSCVAALQGAILLIAAKRSDQVSSELAQHDYEADVSSRQLLIELRADFATQTKQISELMDLASSLHSRLDAMGRRDTTP